MPGKRLTSEERAQIEVLFGQGRSFPQIAEAIGRDRVTVWREVCRNNSHRGAGVRDGAVHPMRRGGYVAGTGYVRGWGGAYATRYSHERAQAKAERRAKRRRACKLRPHHGRPAGLPQVWVVVKGKLGEKWSPLQISRWLREQYPEQPEWWVSTETIYQAVIYQGRGGLRELIDHRRSCARGAVPPRPVPGGPRGPQPGKPWVEAPHLRPPGRGRRPGRARALGRRPAHRRPQRPPSSPSPNAPPGSSCSARCPSTGPAPR